LSTSVISVSGHAVAPALPDVLPEPKQRGRVMGALNRHPTIVLGGTVVSIMVLIALLAPCGVTGCRVPLTDINLHLLGTLDPTALAPAKRTRPPSELNWFGTDMLGRDVYSRVIWGSRVSLTIGFSVAAVASIIGTTLGLIAGFTRWVDAVVMRVMDGLMSIPGILLAIALMALTRASMQNVIIAISVSEFPRVCRLVRGVVLSLREQPYVEAAIASGTRTPVIIWRHILPNTLAPLMVQATFICASAMITEATLSFLGAGTPPTIPSWGNIMAEGRALWQVKPYIVFFPAIFLSITVLAVNMLGDGLRDALDPRLAKRL
jgi:peptide/nickel transport system permease protein